MMKIEKMNGVTDLTLEEMRTIDGGSHFGPALMKKVGEFIDWLLS
jgi:hypothetical protein